MHQKKLDVDFGIERQYVFDILTSDISVADCILDLIDNSIDAARRDIFKKAGKAGLPDSYSGYEINVKIAHNKIEITDNCLGIDPNLLANTTFRAGARHIQNFSIGIYGVGLIRAFWKLGNRGTLTTDTGETAYKISFSKRQIEASENQKLPASPIKSTGKKKNHFVISEITEDTKIDLRDTEWIKLFKEKVQCVFGLCIRKGLKIKIEGSLIPEFGPRIREDIPQLKGGRSFVTKEGVDVHIEYGAHEKYRFKDEPGWSAPKNGELTPEFGWYVVCNDRIVLVADLSLRVGWSQVWHSEYNGFIGWVYFTSKDAKLLPWDSSKTDISLEKRSQREVAPVLRAFADAYRRVNRSYRYSPTNADQNANTTHSRNSNQEAGEGQSQTPDQQEKNRQRSQPENSNTPSTRRRNPKPKPEDHNENWETLFPDVQVAYHDRKLKALVTEAQLLPLRHPYAGTMLFRVIVERALNNHIRALNKLKSVKQHIFDEAEKANKPIKEENKKMYAPQLSQIVSWVAANPDIFPDDKTRDLSEATRLLKAHLREINKVVHEGGLTSSAKLRIVRDDCWHLVEYLLEHNPSQKDD
jgi:hypothetical protein